MTLEEIKGRKKKKACQMLLLGLAALGIAVGTQHYEFAVQVRSQQGEVLCIAQNQEQVEEAISQVEHKAQQNEETDYDLNVSDKYIPVVVPKEEVSDSQQVYDTVVSQAQGMKEMTLLKVDGQTIGGSQDQEGLEQMLQELKQQYTTGQEGETVEFTRQVELVQALAKEEEEKPLSQLKEELTATTTQQTQVTVGEGQNLADVAQEYDTSVQQLQQLNGGTRAVSEGDTLTVEQTEPLVQVKVSRTETTEETIPFETVVEKDDTLPANLRKVEQEGAEGVRQVTTCYSTIDGVEQEPQVEETKVLKEVQQRIIKIGTQPVPESTPKNYLVLPAEGMVTSPYGPRSSGFHTGIDIAASEGSPVVAANGGKVIFAGWKGGYGNCVILDHGNGVTTLYAHNQELLVEEGMEVVQGQQLAKMGKTGNATGSHCHFELLINGEDVDPTAYLYEEKLLEWIGA